MAAMATSPAYSGDQRAKVLGTYIPLHVLAGTAIILRFFSRYISQRKFQADDYCAVAMTAMFVGTIAVNAIQLQNGLGRHALTLSASEIDTSLKTNFAAEALYPLALTTIKSTILCMYLGIFGINIVFRRCTYVLLVVAALWGISTGLVAIFQCHPIAAAYDMKLQQMKGTKCIHLTQYLVSTSILNVVVDAVILVLPLRILWTLQLRTSRKVSLSFVFLLGIFTTAISTVRTIAISTLTITDPTWDLVPLEMYSSLEIDSGIICACLPAMAPLLQKLFGHRTSGRSDYNYGSSLKRNQWSSSRGPPVYDGSFTRLHGSVPTQLAGVSTLHGKPGPAEADDLEMNKLHVTTEITVDQHYPFREG